MWGDRGGLPGPLFRSLRQVLPSARVLAWGRGDSLVIAGTPAALAVERGDGWQVTMWHEIRTATWDQSTTVLAWRDAQGAHEVRLSEPGKVPNLVKDRVEASLVVDDRSTQAGVQVVVTARQNLLDPHASLIWDVYAVDGRTLDRPGLREAAQARVAELQADLT